MENVQRTICKDTDAVNGMTENQKKTFRYTKNQNFYYHKLRNICTASRHSAGKRFPYFMKILAKSLKNTTTINTIKNIKPTN